MDLTTAREAVITWLWARRDRVPLCVHGHPEALKALSWVGLDWEETLELAELPGPLEERADGVYIQGVRVLDELEHPTPAAAWAELGKRLQPPRLVVDPARRGEIEDVGKLGFHPEVTWLAPLEGGQATLEELSRRGVLSEATLSYLAESAWSAGPCLTRGQLLRQFDPAGLRTSPVRFQAEELDARQRHFLATLTPGELWERSLGFWPHWALPDELTDEQLNGLERLAQLYGGDIRYLADFPRLVQFYFVDPPAQVVPEDARRALEAAPEWSATALARALEGRDTARLELAVLGAPAAPAPLPALLALLGRDRVLSRVSVAPAR